MIKPFQPSTLPDWLKPLLRRAIRNEPDPAEVDYEISSAAMAGVELRDLRSRFELDTEGIVAAIRRVACAVRDRSAPESMLERYPDVEAFAGKKAREKKKSELKIQIMSPTELVNCDHLLTNDPESLPEFLREVKHQAARTLAPATMAALATKVMLGHDAAINKSLELLWGVGKRGPGTALQVNIGGSQKEPETPHFFEQTILEAEKQEGAKGGESTMFDERLLGQQDDEAN